MKKLLCLLTLASFSLISIGQNVPSYVPTNGLVGWWPFNGNANDESGNGNHGTVYGAILSADRFGNSNACFEFDGINDYLNISYSNSLSPSTGSVSFWMKTKGRINSLQHTYGQGYGRPGMGVSPDNHLHKAVLAWGTASGEFPYVVSTSDVDSGNWVYVVGIYSTTEFKIYINGILENVSTTGLSQYYCNAPIQIGGYNYSPYCGFGAYSGQFLNGLIDDIAIYNRALTQQEITNLYNASVPPTPCNPLPSNLQSGLVGYWPFCGNANDESGNGNNGTVNGATLTVDRFGDSGRAYSFDGLDDFVSVNPSASLIFPDAITIAGWYKPSAINGIRMLVARWNNDLGQSFQCYLNNGIFEYSINDGNTNQSDTSSLSLINNEWISIAFTFQSPNIFKIFKDGLLIFTDSLSIIDLNNPNTKLYFGAREISNSLWDYFFDGVIDDIAIWNRALSPSEITQLYKTQSSNLSEGNVGVNVQAPQRSLHIKDVIRLEPRNSAPENPVKGDIYFDNILNKIRAFDGTTWQNCW